MVVGHLLVELGPQLLACSDEPALASPSNITAPTTAAPQPIVVRASHWDRSAPPPLAARIRATATVHSVREEKVGSAAPKYDGSVFAPTRHETAYAPDRCSLSVRFAVHETGRNLDTGRNFGRHVRSLRRARGMTQEVLAERSGLSPDTVRRLEHGSFSPSLDTLRKLCGGLDLMLSTLFESYELGSRNETRELIDLLAARGTRELVLATRVLRALFEELDGIAAEAEESEPDPEAEGES
jgi:transcriptional regulator with XRE-family HTH domain